MLDSCSSLRRSRTHLIHGFLSPLKPITKRHLNRFGSFYRAHNCDKQTDRPCYSVCNNRLHLHNSTTMRPKNGLCAPAHPHLGIVCHGASSWYHLHAYKIWRLCFQFEDSIFSRSKIMQLECGPMPNLMVVLSNIGGALCSTPQSLADAHY